MNLEEMQLAVCEKLPKLVRINPTNKRIHWKLIVPLRIWHKEVHWPTEGLQVCHEATILLGGGATIVYTGTQWMVRIGDSQPVFNKDLLAAWLEALTRVWWPERFE